MHGIVVLLVNCDYVIELSQLRNRAGEYDMEILILWTIIIIINVDHVTFFCNNFFLLLRHLQTDSKILHRIFKIEEMLV